MAAFDVIAICSYDRPQAVCDKTLMMLSKMRDVGMSRVFVLVPGPEQGSMYRAAIAAAGYSDVTVCDDMPLGMGPARNALHTRWPEGTRVISMDDDLRGLHALDATGEKMVRLDRLKPTARRAFGACARAGAVTWGIYPVKNALFMKPKVTTDLRLLLGVCYGFISEGDQAPQIDVKVKTDYAWTLASFVKHGAVVRLWDIAADTKVYGNAGGFTSERTPDLAEASIVALEAKYPGLVARKRGTSTGFPEMRLVPGLRPTKGGTHGD